MDTLSSKVIDALGGTTAVARLTETPVSTVHSWRKIGIPPSRLAHLRLVAQVHDKLDAFEKALTPATVSADAPRAAAG